MKGSGDYMRRDYSICYLENWDEIVDFCSDPTRIFGTREYREREWMDCLNRRIQQTNVLSVQLYLLKVGESCLYLDINASPWSDDVVFVDYREVGDSVMDDKSETVSCSKLLEYVKNIIERNNIGHLIAGYR